MRHRHTSDHRAGRPAKPGRGEGALSAMLRDESGIAMILVMGVMVLLFLLATMLLVTSSYMTSAVRNQEARTKSVHIADAGLNAYLYELRRDPTYFATHPTLGPTDQDDGRWVVAVTAPTTSTPLTLRAVGSLRSRPTSVTVVATVRFPTFADFMFLSDADINVGPDARIVGKVRSNGTVNNNGEITGATYARNTITGSGLFGTALPGGSVTKYPNSPRVDFAQVTADTDLIRAAAQGAGSYYGASGALGYRVTFNGTLYSVEKVTGGTNTGNLVTSPVAGGTNVPIPPVGVIYLLDDVWVRGTYSAPVTVCGSRDIYVPENLRPTSMNSKATAGLVAQRNIVVPTWYPSVPNDMTLTAALLAQTGTVYGDLSQHVLKDRITITGSSSYFTYGYFAQVSGSTVIRGWRQRVYTYDQRLDDYPPPRYPVLHDGSLKVDTWMED